MTRKEKGRKKRRDATEGAADSPKNGKSKTTGSQDNVDPRHEIARMVQGVLSASSLVRGSGMQ
jgi:hypothetical protein